MRGAALWGLFIFVMNVLYCCIAVLHRGLGTGELWGAFLPSNEKYPSDLLGCPVSSLPVIQRNSLYVLKVLKSDIPSLLS